MEKITSKNNNLIKKATKLSTSPSFRRKCGEFLLEGVRLCFDALNSDVYIVNLLVTESCIEKWSEKVSAIAEKCEQAFIISDDVASKLADTVTTQGMFCICRFRSFTDEILSYKKYIALENVQDPSNLGAAARTAEALGIDGIILCSGADMYSPKSMRASMGSLLRINVIHTSDMKETIEKCNSSGMVSFACVPDASAEKINEVNFNTGVLAVIGNEGNGVTKEVINTCTKRVTIPMLGRAESLNAAAAASIVMWEMVRGGRND